ncbi:dTDP-4-dehydrorhamnose reductase [Metabacillus halosaccharovorans]|uniref:dTDP-4-dehydrorhamnose reductase n=1 Tax=Metabacillus halosaccharovorans TaxID=930124 RepID=UPI00203E4703|nr:dTDP-4-dehydrorhamnose reductase [Metabacillus halosaccharovorans]MCM3444719.1 dTDP-4-dehydrorhamnose reductase [Metabacillus halosaccharovorans]
MLVNKILITGGAGQLGTELTIFLEQQGYHVYSFDKKNLDVTNYEQVKEIFYNVRPNIIFHSAAYTQVDNAEVNNKKANFINIYGTRNIALAAEQIDAKLIYFSTDYVFKGDSKTPYNEWDTPDPINVYGKSKLEGERLLKILHSRYFIVRTSWLYGNGGNNFIKKILNKAKLNGEILKVVDDQVGSPTYTFDIVSKLLQIINTENYGVYHISNTGECSWYEFAKAILEEVGIEKDIIPVPSCKYKTLATRPSYSALDNMVLRLNGISDLRHWRQALKDYIRTYHI